MEFNPQEVYINWKNQFGFLGPKQGEVSDNDCLFTAYFIVACHLLGYKFNKEVIDNLLKQHFDEDGIRHRVESSSKTNHASHDNVTALYCLSYLYELDYHKRINPFYTKCFHPRDIFFYTALKYKWLRFIMIPYSFIFMVSAVDKLEIRPSNIFVLLFKRNYKIVKTDVNFFSTKYHQFEDLTIKLYQDPISKSEFSQYLRLATSTKLLCFLRFNTLDFGFLEKIFMYFIKNIFHIYPWYEVSHIYFRDVNHPVVRAIHEYYSKLNGINTDNPVQ